MGFSNSEALAVLKWMVRTRLLETLYETDPRAAFDRRIRDDFAELMEAGVITFADAAHGENGAVTITAERDGDRFSFGARVVEGRIEIERRAAYMWSPGLRGPSDSDAPYVRHAAREFAPAQRSGGRAAAILPNVECSAEAAASADARPGH